MPKKKRLRTKPTPLPLSTPQLVRIVVLAILAATGAVWALVHHLRRVPEPMLVSVPAPPSAPSTPETEIPAPEILPK